MTYRIKAYKGSSAALNDLMGSQANSMFGTMLVAVPNVRSGAIKAIAVALDSQELADKLAAGGSTPAHSTPTELRALMQAEQAKWKDVVERAGVTIQ